MRWMAMGFLMVLSGQVTGQIIGEATLCENVVSLNAVNPKTAFASGQKAYLWMRVNEATPGSSISVEWICNDKMQHTTPLNLPYASMRTYAFKTLGIDGVWTVVIRAADGRELKRLTCTAGSGQVASGSTEIISSQSSSTVVAKPSAATTSSSSSTTVTPVKPNALTLDPGFELEIKENSKILLPPQFDKNRKYPVLVFLPPTGMSAEGLFENYVGMGGAHGSTPMESLLQGLFADKTERKRKEFIVVLPAGYGSTTDHSWMGFSACIHRYEEKVLNDLKRLSQEYSVDETKVVLTGFSLGGDLSWAISHRYPYSFCGGIISGSRISYNEPGKMDHLSKQHVKYYLALGEFESDIRKTVFEQSKQLLDKNAIRYKSVVIKGGEHAPMTFDQLREGINFVMFGED